MTNDNYWDTLPDELQDVIIAYKKLIECATVVQNHYRKVRYSPGEAPDMVPGKGQRALVHFFKNNCDGKIPRYDYGLNTNWVAASVIKGVTQATWYNQPPGKGEWINMKHTAVQWNYYKEWNMAGGSTIYGKYYQQTVWFDPKDRPEWAYSPRYNHLYPDRDLHDHVLRPVLVIPIKKW